MFWFIRNRLSGSYWALIRAARLVVLEGSGSAPFLGDADGVIAAIDAFSR